MDFDLVDWALDFFAQNQLFCYVAAGILVVLIIWKPGKILKNAFLLLVLLGLIYFVMQIFTSINVGRSVKDKAIHKTERAMK